MPNANPAWMAARVAAAAAVALPLAVALPGLASAKPPAAAGIEGTWSGGGAVAFASGGRENARCRVRYARRSADTYTGNAVCATASARVAQTVTLRRVGENRYSGSFYNSEYDVSGSIYVVARGNSQTVTLRSASGSAWFKLHR